jgi:alkanesulfonate monooxygenase SsuD/methylene tetrahydromethanopterin reductase-like flavin-dependent oxidoreductase (luciferase family)
MSAPGLDVKRSLVFATGALDPLVPLAQEAEAANFHRVWTTEYLHRDAVARALAVALGTETINVGTGIAYAFARVPLQMAALAADVQRLAGGRFGLGISTGTRGVRRWYGAEFEPPAPRLAEYVKTLRETWCKNPDLPAPPPVYAAALNPIMTKTMARDCDGVLLHALSLSRVHLRERVLPALEAGRAQRTLSTPLEVAAWCIASIDADEELARERARRQLAFYLVTPSYKTVAEGTPWAGTVARLREAFNDAGRAPEWGRYATLIPDEIVNELTISGTPSSAAAQLAALEDELHDLGVTEIVFQTVGADLTDAEVVDNCRQIVSGLRPTPQSQTSQRTPIQ